MVPYRYIGLSELQKLKFCGLSNIAKLNSVYNSVFPSCWVALNFKLERCSVEKFKQSGSEKMPEIYATPLLNRHPPVPGVPNVKKMNMSAFTFFHNPLERDEWMHMAG